MNITDLNLAAALLSCGETLKSEAPFLKLITNEGIKISFDFVESETLAENLATWENPAASENPMAYLRAFTMNRTGILKEIHDAPGLIQMVKNGKTLLVSENASDEQKAKLLARL